VRLPTLLSTLGLAAWVLAAPFACRDSGGREPRAPAQDGVAAGDVDAASAVVWVRARAAGPVRVEVAEEARPERPVFAAGLRVGAVDVPAKAEVSGLAAATRYVVRATWPEGRTARARFRTAAPAGERRGLRFGVSGDWAGDLAPYPSVGNVPARDLDFFVAVGDTVYADIASPAVPFARATTLAQQRAKHAEGYSARFGVDALAEARASTAWFATIDDHELSDAFAGLERVRPFLLGRARLANETAEYRAALRAFHEWNPIRETRWSGTGDAAVDGRPDLYRRRVLGADAVLLVLDTRSFRSPPLDRPSPDPDSLARWRAASLAAGRTILGAPQRERLLADLRAAEAAGVLWKFVATPTPIQHLGSDSGRDRWEGYAHERERVLRVVRDERIRNVVFVTGDIHGYAVNDLEVRAGAAAGRPQKTGAIEVATLPVGVHGVLGRYVVRGGDLSAEERRAYADAGLDGKDDAARRVLDGRLSREGFGPLGLEDADLGAALREGRWLRGHSYGWCEFEVDRASGALTVTTWGVDAHAPQDEREAAAPVPTVLARFTLPPRPPAPD
jgi:phosphodiesterase/alkaline phosphatase D-like protein